MTTAISADLRAAAHAAILDAADEPGPVQMVAAKILRDRTGLTLIEVIGAIKWALEHPQAEHLPVDSIVALRSTVAVKRVMVDGDDEHWQVTRANVEGTDWISNAEVDGMIQADGATVLRVGGGR